MWDFVPQHNNSPLLSKQLKEPLFNVPFIIIVLIAFCFFGYIIPQYFLSDQLYMRSLILFSFIPVFFQAEPLMFCYTIVSYSFMHGSFGHIAMNMVWLLVFGSPLAKHFGNLRFLLFWMLTAGISALTYFIFHQDSMIPLVGASGAISGMMGAIARYGFFIVFNSNIHNERFLGPVLPIKKALRSKTVLVYIGMWLIINCLTGIFPYLFGDSDILIAWEAHVGGLISGFMLISFFDSPRKKSKINV
ncbi:rhomboid family intramembrane serine protease [Bartonella schoenbuchensis]|uniref:Membrane protein, rhomboid family n=1 Tax=Bartonella schoenbuchensis m07a TaxID=1094496 RepID=N6VKR5_9HYPH|nr:rhomboid family intramembrane serine protease [Bartonella schoenbuchensis]ENN91597.1 putative membrane protein, rhomboid family [Bartonella schoenbuchensis m07a]